MSESPVPQAERYSGFSQMTRFARCDRRCMISVRGSVRLPRASPSTMIVVLLETKRSQPSSKSASELP